MKYEKPDIEVILFDDIMTSSGGLIESSNEGGSEPGFPGISGTSLED